MNGCEACRRGSPVRPAGRQNDPPRSRCESTDEGPHGLAQCTLNDGHEGDHVSSSVHRWWREGRTVDLLNELRQWASLYGPELDEPDARSVDETLEAIAQTVSRDPH